MTGCHESSGKQMLAVVSAEVPYKSILLCAPRLKRCQQGRTNCYMKADQRAFYLRLGTDTHLDMHRRGLASAFHRARCIDNSPRGNWWRSGVATTLRVTEPIAFAVGTRPTGPFCTTTMTLRSFPVLSRSIRLLARSSSGSFSEPLCRCSHPTRHTPGSRRNAFGI